MRRGVKIGDREIGPGCPVLLVAAIGSNHDGSLERALMLIDAAAAAGADAVRFQSFRAASLLARRWPRPGGGWQACEQYAQRERLEMPPEWHAALRNRARQRGIVFLSTPYDEGRAALLASLGVPAFRVSCGDLTHAPLVRALGGYGRPVLLSTGLATAEDIEEALRALAAGAGDDGRRPPTVLVHCGGGGADADLRILPALQARFDALVGWSDHAPGHVLAVGAVALGASVIEKPLTDDRGRFGGAHAAALEPIDFLAMTRAVRALEAGLGAGDIVPRGAAAAARERLGRGVYAARSLPAGTVLDASDLKVVRPALGASPAALPRLVGRRLARRVSVDEPLTEDACGGDG